MKSLKVFLSLKLHIMFNRKSFYLIWLLISLITSVLIFSLYRSAEQGVQIPIAVVDGEETEFSGELIRSISEHPSLIVMETSLKEGEDLLATNLVEGLLIVNEGATEKVLKGELENIMTVRYLNGNYFIMMLTDMVSGQILNEISLITAGRYYEYAKEDLLGIQSSDSPLNEVYYTGSLYDFSDRSGYYLDVELVGDNPKTLETYKENLLGEKMTVGTVYIFIAFFILFEGLQLLSERKSATFEKILILPNSNIIFSLSEFITLVISGIMISIPLTIISGVFNGEVVYVFAVNLLFVISTSTFIYLLAHILTKEYLYLLGGTAVILGTGIVSGSFFAIDYANETVAFIASLFPNFYSMNAYFDKSIIREYSGYTVLYTALVFGFCLIIDEISLRSKT